MLATLALAGCTADLTRVRVDGQCMGFYVLRNVAIQAETGEAVYLVVARPRTDCGGRGR